MRHRPDPNVRKLKYLSNGGKYFNKGKLQKAVVEFRNVLQIDSRFVPAHYQLARTYQRLKIRRQPSASSRKPFTVDPQNLTHKSS